MTGTLRPLNKTLLYKPLESGSIIQNNRLSVPKRSDLFLSFDNDISSQKFSDNEMIIYHYIALLI